MAHQQGLHRRHHRTIGEAQQKAQHAQLRCAGHKGHGDKQQQRDRHRRQQNTLCTNAIAESPQPGCGQQSGHAGQRGDHPAEKRDVLRMGRQLPHKQRQDGVNRPVTHLNHQGGKEQAEHQSGVIQRAEHLASAELLLFTHRGVAGLFDQEECDQKTDQQQSRGDHKDHAQPHPVSQQPAQHRSQNHPANLAGGDTAQRPAAAFTRHLSGHQRHGVGDIAGGQPHQGAQQQQLPGFGDKSLQQDHDPHASSGAQQHQFPPFAIGQAAPQWRNGR